MGNPSKLTMENHHFYPFFMGKLTISWDKIHPPPVVFLHGSTISADWRRGAVLGRSSKPSEPGAGKVHQKWPFSKGGKGWCFLENDGKMMGKWWEHEDFHDFSGKMMGTWWCFWENDGKRMMFLGKWWENDFFRHKNLENYRIGNIDPGR